jgi:hypothetical protein
VMIKAQLFFHEQDLLILLDPCPKFSLNKIFFLLWHEMSHNTVSLKSLLVFIIPCAIEQNI